MLRASATPCGIEEGIRVMSDEAVNGKKRWAGGLLVVHLIAFTFDVAVGGNDG
jgi:hypothetical protein